ncbi:MAG: DUF4417 domain-containing protein [Armatimonadetes bacterium]|nr:DUF4417 domain-containing protein [Armatimonadota bacterium]
MRSACGLDCVKCLYGDFCSGCPGCRAALCDRVCGTCHYVCPRRPGAVYFLNSLGGPRLPDLSYVPPALPDLHGFIPAVATRFSETPDQKELPWVAMNAARLLLSRGEEGGLAHRVGAREFCRVHPDTRIMLHFYVPDRPLEAFWRKRWGIYPALKEFDLVIAPNYSVYEDSPRLEHLINIKRSYVVYREMLARGIKAIPDVSWGEIRDLERWAEFIRNNQVRVISTSIQTVKRNSTHKWLDYLAGVRYLAGLLPDDVTIIICGAGSPGKIKMIRRAIRQKVAIINTQAFMLARKSRTITKTGRAIVSGERKYDEMFIKNAKTLAEYAGDRL